MNIVIEELLKTVPEYIPSKRREKICEFDLTYKLVRVHILKDFPFHGRTYSVRHHNQNCLQCAQNEASNMGWTWKLVNL